MICHPMPAIEGVAISEFEKPREVVLKELITALLSALGPHDDNCGGTCNPSLDGHDCCIICNTAENMVLAFDKQRCLFRLRGEE